MSQTENAEPATPVSIGAAGSLHFEEQLHEQNLDVPQGSVLRSWLMEKRGTIRKKVSRLKMIQTKQHPRQMAGVNDVGITYLPGKSPCKYCRRG